jgi:hypothetical protein
LAIQAIEI